MADRTTTQLTAADAHSHSERVFVIMEQAEAVAELIFQVTMEGQIVSGQKISSAAGALSTLLAQAQELQGDVMGPS